jgi:hypothetical protein
VVAPSKLKKVEIDDRFKKMYKDKEFNTIATVDKYGRRVKQEDKMALQNYYEKRAEDEQKRKE